jgi:predicted metal-dependent peptidase
MQDINQQSLNKLCKQLIWNDPFYGNFLLMLDKKFSKDVPTAGVHFENIQPVLLINPDFWESLSDDHKYGLLKHEVMHIMFFHCTDFEHLVHKNIANIAMDLYINQWIDKKHLPDGGCFVENFAKYGCQPNESTNDYYKKLLKEAEMQSKSAGDKVGDGKGVVPEHHWDKAEEIKAKLIQKQIENNVVQLASEMKKQGALPGEIENLLEKIINKEPPKFNWKAYFRRFIDVSSKELIAKTRRKESNRFEGEPGLRIKSLATHLLCLDTSASVSDEEIKELLGEVYHMYKTGHDFIILQFDTKITNTELYKPNKPIILKGRGGTNFTDPMNYFLKNRRKFASISFLTDGEAYNPEPCYKNTLWIHTSKSSINESLTGKKIKL